MQWALSAPLMSLVLLECRDCKVDSVEKFGLLVELLPGKTGLVHSSELDVDRTVSPESFNVGDRLDVKCLEVRLISR
jgi:ribosomal protein S1